jgi:hypothetical protein
MIEPGHCCEHGGRHIPGSPAMPLIEKMERNTGLLGPNRLSSGAHDVLVESAGVDAVPLPLVLARAVVLLSTEEGIGAVNRGLTIIDSITEDCRLNMANISVRRNPKIHLASFAFSILLCAKFHLMPC